MKTLNYSRAAARFLIAWSATLLLAGPVQADAFTQQVRERVAALVNALRDESGLRPLEREPRLDEAAERFAGHMARTGRLDHHADGAAPRDRVRQRGYAYCNLAENIAMEYSSRGFTMDALARHFIEGWRESPSHRANMLDPVVTQTGIGVARNAQGEYFATQIFARPVIPGAKGRAACPR